MTNGTGCSRQPRASRGSTPREGWVGVEGGQRGKAEDKQDTSCQTRAAAAAALHTDSQLLSEDHCQFICSVSISSLSIKCSDPFSLFLPLEYALLPACNSYY